MGRCDWREGLGTNRDWVPPMPSWEQVVICDVKALHAASATRGSGEVPSLADCGGQIPGARCVGHTKQVGGADDVFTQSGS